ncbi:hypothetical protein QFC22_001163 [Naganishia vaughanmartiniae]|uniref:Uncharacterized protein n=1 Tax=Naganishia vaughanmartiniae TaxID=1424756 RepID=A0ACC2XKH4_9TREE|nr:hypothetical protein QFC22_001163 [Naganishia vaughanmartiniae]
MDSDQEEAAMAATRLVGKKGGFIFEMSVEVEGQPLKIYDKDEQTKGIERDIVRGYIASQEGKVRNASSTEILDIKLEDENEAMQPVSPSSSVVPFAEPELDLGSDLTSEDSGYLEPNHRGIEVNGELVEKLSRSPEGDELGSEEDDKKRIKVSDGVGQREDNPIEIGNDSDDDSEILAAREAARVVRARKLEELEEMQA